MRNYKIYVKNHIVNINKKIKNNKGSITSFTLLSMMFFMIVIIAIYIGVSNKVQKQEKELNTIQKSYEKKETINDIYEKKYDNYINSGTSTIQVYADTTLKGEIKGQKKNTIGTVYTNTAITKIKLFGGINNKYAYSETADGKKIELEGNELTIDATTRGKTIYTWVKGDDGEYGSYYTAVIVKLTTLENKTIYVAEGQTVNIGEINGENIGKISFDKIDTSMITVTDNKVTGIKAGDTTFIATELNGGSQSTITVKITKLTLETQKGITIFGTNKTIQVSGINNGALTVKSSDETIAKVAVSGTQVIINPQKVGNAKITITEQNAGASIEYEIQIANITLAPNGGKYTMPTDGNATIKTKVNVENANKIEVAWTSTNLEWKTIENNTEVIKNDCTNGTYYLYVKLDNDFMYQSEAFSVGNNTITITPSPTTWTNGNVTTTIAYPDVTTSSTRKAGYGSTLANAQTASNSATAPTTSVTVTANGYVFATATDSAGNVITASKQITNIDKTAPTITSAEIKNITTTGYDVYVYGVQDSGSGVNRVQFPTWTNANGQDDIQANWPTSDTAKGTKQADGTTWVYHVKTTDHKNEAGTYYTHVYVYDNLENSTCISSNTITVPTVKITYDENYNSVKTTVEKAYNTALGTLSTPKRPGYKFDGWYTEPTEGTKIIETTKTPAENTTYYAHWIIEKYNVNYDANGGTGSMATDTTYYNTSYSVQENKFSREGYTFKGWNEKADGSGVDWTDYIGKPNNWTYENNVTLYAQWDRNTFTLDVNTIKNGEIFTEGWEGLTFSVDVTDLIDSSNNSKYDAKNVIDYNQKIPYNCKYSITVDDVAGFTKKNPSNASGKIISEDITVFPEWTGNKYSVIFISNSSEANGTMEKQEFTYGQTEMLNKSEFSRTGFIITGWATSANGEKVYEDMDLVSNLTATQGGTVNLYAVWLEAMDISSLSIDSVTHTCIWATKYDGSNHWEYCTVCGATKNVTPHTYTKTSNIASSIECSPVNQYYYTCECGYSYSYRPSCISDGIWHPTQPERHLHYQTCKNCGTWTTSQRCYDSNGKILNCGNPGTCVVCGLEVKSTYHYISSNGVCDDCGTRFFTTGNVSISYSNDYKTCTYSYPVTVQNGFEFTGIPGRSYNSNCNEKSYTATQIKNESTYTFTYVFTFDESLQRAMYPTFGDGNYGMVNGNYVYLCNINPVGNTNIYQDHESPTITSIVQTNQQSNGIWTTTKSFDISGTENLSQRISVRLLNSSNDTVYTGTAVVENGTWSLKFTPAIEQMGSATWKVLISDQLGNSYSKAFTISNIDSKAPVLISNPDATGVWYKYRTINISATDEGSGSVKIGLNKLSDLKLANYSNGVYSRNYTVTGDSYSSIRYAILMEDEAGNKSTTYIGLGMFDNTLPTMTEVSANGNKVSITANDLNETLGLTGSGVKEYGYLNINRDKKITWSNNPNITLPTSGNYLIVVRDGAGNISIPYRTKI